MNKIKQKLVNGLAIAFLVLMTCVYVVSFMGKRENVVKAEPVPLLSKTATTQFIPTEHNVDFILTNLVSDTVRQVTYAKNEQMEFYQLAFTNYLLSATHQLPVKFQKEKWTFDCVDKEGNRLDVRDISDDTENILRSICIQNTPKPN